MTPNLGRGRLEDYAQGVVLDAFVLKESGDHAQGVVLDAFVQTPCQH